MSLETRHTEKILLFNILKAQKRNPMLAEAKEIKDIVLMLEATMEPEDVQLVLKKVAELD